MKTFNIDVFRTVYRPNQIIKLFLLHSGDQLPRDRINDYYDIAINDKVVIVGLHPHELSFALINVMDKVDLTPGETFEVKVHRMNNATKVGTSRPLTLLLAKDDMHQEILQHQQRHNAWETLNRFVRTLFMYRDRIDSLELPETTPLFSWEVGPVVFQLQYTYIDEESETGTLELIVSPTRNMTDIQVIDISKVSTFRALLELIVNKLGDDKWRWLMLPSFRAAILEEPIGSDLMYHYHWLLTWACAERPEHEMSSGFRNVLLVSK